MKSLLEIYFDWQNKNPWQAWKEWKSVRFLLPLLFGMCGFFIVWEYGPFSMLGHAHDSVQYRWSSKFLYSIEGIKELVVFAPLYSILLSIPQFFGVSLHNSIGLLGALGHGILLFCCASILLKHTRFFLLFFLGTLSIIANLHIAERYTWSTSDPFFATFCILFLIYLLHTMEKPTYRKIFLLGFLAALCALQRYIGTIAIAFGGVVILFFLNKTAFFTRIKYSALFGLTASTPLFLWLMKNLYFTGTLTGGRPVEYTSLFEQNLAVFSKLYTFIIQEHRFLEATNPIYSFSKNFFVFLIIISFLIIALIIINLFTPPPILKRKINLKLNG